MKKWIAASLPVVLASVFAGCGNNGELTPEIKLTIGTEEVVATASGGKYKVDYKLEGLSAAEKPEATCAAAWINDFDAGNSGELSFNVDANDAEEEREAIVLVTCAGAEAEFIVRQEAAENRPGLAISIEEIFDAGVVYRVVPEDLSMTYMTMVAEKSYFDSYESDESYFEDELDFFKSGAEVSGISLKEYLAPRLKHGEVAGPAYRLQPETSYYAYAYGMTEDGNRLTDIYKAEFTTVAVELSDVALDISYMVAGTVVTMTVTPDDPDQLYLFNAVEAASVSGDAFLLDAAKQEIEQYVQFYEMLGVPQDQAVLRFANKGVSSYTFDGMLEPDTDYVGYAVALTPLGSICSDIVSKRFRTESDKPQEKPIVLSLTNLTDQEVSVLAKTGLAEHYVVGIDYSSSWDGMTDREILDRLVAGYQWQAKGADGGDASFTFYGLTPHTRYSIFAFGYVGGVATTELCRIDFTTDDAAAADIIFRMEYDKYFDGTELAAIDSKYLDADGKAVLPVRLVTDGAPCAEIYYGFYEGDYTDTGRWPDDVFMEELLDVGYWQYSNIFYLDYDRPYTMIGFGVDDDFAFGPMARQLVCLSRDGVSPVSEFKPAASSIVASASRIVPLKR